MSSPARKAARRPSTAPAPAPDRPTTPVPAAPPVRFEGPVLLGAAVAALAALLAFGPAAGNGWMDQLDDQANFLGNLGFRGLGPAQLGWAWTTRLLGVWQPLAWMLLEVQHALFGLGPAGYHATSVALHMLVSVALYALILELLGRAGSGIEPRDRRAMVAASAIAAAIFAAHPLRTEVVAWASCQPYLPCALFMILATIAYLKSTDTPAPFWRSRAYWLAVGLYAAAGLSKAVAVGLPAVLLVLNAYPLRRLGRGRAPGLGRVLAEIVPFAVIAAFVAGMAVWARAGSLRPIEANGPIDRLMQSAYGLAFYPTRTLAPVGLTAFHIRPEPFEPFALAMLAGLLASIVLIAVAALSARRWAGVAAAIAAYALIVAPNLGLLQSNEFLVAERYAYASTMGLYALLAGGLVWGWRRSGRSPATAAGLGAACLALLAICIPLSRSQARTWRDAEALWAAALAAGTNRDDAMHANLAASRLRAGDVPAAIEHLNAALRINPRSADVRTKLALARLGGDTPDADAAAAEAEQAVALARDEFRRRLPDGRNRLAGALDALAQARHEQGRADEAVASLDEAIALLEPIATGPAADLSAQAFAGAGEAPRRRLAAMWHRRGVWRLKAGAPASEVESDFAEAVRLDPALAGARNDLGLMLVRRGDFQAALDQFAEAVRLAPREPEYHLNLGGALFQLGRLPDAERAFAESLRLDPQSAKARQNLSVVRGRLAGGR